MNKKIFAIANCRVSSPEQLLNNSLNRQEKSVKEAAKRLGVEIVETWSGSVSSKAGTNINRKDLLGMLDYCSKHKNVKYAIFDEYDRFMRSGLEGPYFEVRFMQLGVKVWFASETDEFNGNNATAKLLRSLSAFKAEGSNEERQRKSISGQVTALKEGRYTFHPKPGYIKGEERGIHEVHPVDGPILKSILTKIAARHLTPSRALVELNSSDFRADRPKLKMDKFRKVIIDPYYAGIVEIDKQVKCRNENGLHEPLITKEEHLELVRIMDSKKKNQAGPRKNGNPKYPLNNIVCCSECMEARNGRVVGFDHTNGKYPKVYERYRCRSCGKYISKQELHSEVKQRFNENPICDEGIDSLLKALDIVWSRNEASEQQEIVRIKHKVNSLQDAVKRQVSAAIDPSNSTIKQEILNKIEEDKKTISELEDQLQDLTEKKDKDYRNFLKFAFYFIDNLGENFFSLSQEHRLLCKQIIFPGGFYLDANKKVYTPEISPLIRLVTKKKGTEMPSISHLVRVKRL